MHAKMPEGPGLFVPSSVMYMVARLIGSGLNAGWPISPAPGRWDAMAGRASVADNAPGPDEPLAGESQESYGLYSINCGQFFSQPHID